MKCNGYIPDYEIKDSKDFVKKIINSTTFSSGDTAFFKTSNAFATFSSIEQEKDLQNLWEEWCDEFLKKREIRINTELITLNPPEELKDTIKKELSKYSDLFDIFNELKTANYNLTVETIKATRHCLQNMKLYSGDKLTLVLKLLNETDLNPLVIHSTFDSLIDNNGLLVMPFYEILKVLKDINRMSIVNEFKLGWLLDYCKDKFHLENLKRKSISICRSISDYSTRGGEKKCDVTITCMQ